MLAFLLRSLAHCTSPRAASLGLALMIGLPTAVASLDHMSSIIALRGWWLWIKHHVSQLEISVRSPTPETPHHLYVFQHVIDGPRMLGAQTLWYFLKAPLEAL